ncbi:putative membrane-bound dehydrogenase domain-containing protein [Fodinibius roseus]|uniref:Putative membrane-bound dehydrogenase domain-containing protein n=1 Tax=Fodinibius roseus TaxID=1194090 RepID=A0A1M4W215_9BACT|nr:PVC-type heme-binding CxxCH protein [Fodinibius roseus]SHE75163.1 putative membrane-bound dehydrogenase domain-containing protein [Fodinibius roseus]
MRQYIIVGISICIAGLLISCGQQRYPDSLTPGQAIQSFELDERFAIEVFASEPHVLDPVEMVFDAGGNAYVIEMADYPFKSDTLDDSQVVGSISQYPINSEIAEAGGRIRLLVDSDNDGQIDESTIFADSISEGTSILPWKEGLLVTSAPHILYYKDTTGDGRADTREVLFTGFSKDNMQSQITSLRFGVDNWIYASNDGRPGEVRFNRRPEAAPLPVQGADFRFRLDRGEFETATGAGRVGRTFNDWGHRFMSAAVPHIRYAVIPRRYLKRHEHLASPVAIDNINDHGLRMFQLTQAPYWRVERTKRRQQRYDEAGLDRTEYAEDHFTGATGGTYYGAHAFPEEFYGNVFTGESAGNLVHRDILRLDEDSVTYTASRSEEETDREFLASGDPWFRPVTLTVGPDGYLYVIDMYRQHIEHPVAIDEDLKTDIDFSRGREQGRIYRIVPKGEDTEKRISANLKEMDNGELAEHLAHGNQWWRLTAQRLLVERQDRSVVPVLEEMLTQNKDPRARLHALYTLEGLGALNEGLVRQAMEDDHPRLREHGMILSEQYPGLIPQLIGAIHDTSARVALQASLSLGQFEDPRVPSALAETVERHGRDAWFRTAVLSSGPGSSVELMDKLFSRESFYEQIDPWEKTFLKNLCFAIGSRNAEREVIAMLDLLSQLDTSNRQTWQVISLSGLSEGLEKHEDTHSDLAETLQGITESDSEAEITKRIDRIRTYYSGSL